MRLILAIASMLLMVQLHSCIAIALDESYSEEYWTEMAYKLYYEKYYDLALMCINKSIYINSNNSSTWLIKGKILAEIGSQKVNETEKTLYFRQSLNCYNGAIQINPLIKEAWIGKSSILYSLKRYNESLQAYDRASELDPKKYSFNMISPGMVNTGLLSNLPPKLIELTAEANPMKRIAEPSDVAKIISFLLSDQADYLNGVNIPVNGGNILS